MYVFVRVFAFALVFEMCFYIDDDSYSAHIDGCSTVCSASYSCPNWCTLYAQTFTYRERAEGGGRRRYTHIVCVTENWKEKIFTFNLCWYFFTVLALTSHTLPTLHPFFVSTQTQFNSPIKWTHYEVWYRDIYKSPLVFQWLGVFIPMRALFRFG